MNNYANSGFIIKASEIVQHIAPEHRQEVAKAIKSDDTEIAEEILNKYWPNNFAPFASVFVFQADGEPNDDLVDGEMYIEFDTDDLYITNPTIRMKIMLRAGFEPKQARWVTWG
jgi:hypothetical protein